MSYIQIIPEEIYQEKREGWHSASHIESQTLRGRWLQAPGSRLQASQVHIVRPVKKNDNRKRENELTYSKHLLFAGCFTHLEVSSKTQWLPLASYALAISTEQVRKRICPRGVLKALPLGISQDTFLWNFSRLPHMFSSQMEFLN